MNKGTQVRPVRGLAAVALAVVLGLSGCGAGSPTTASWDDTFDFGVPTSPLETAEDVPFYPACGNEVLPWDGERYYPYTPERVEEFPEPATTVVPGVSNEAAGASAFDSELTVRGMSVSMPIGAVAAPGPGDDVGTLVIFEDGHAYWESHNGELQTWLTTRELTYNWVC